MTRLKLSGPNHAAVNAQLPPLLPPQMPHRSGSSAIAQRVATWGTIWVRRSLT